MSTFACVCENGLTCQPFACGCENALTCQPFACVCEKGLNSYKLAQDTKDVKTLWEIK